MTFLKAIGTKVNKNCNYFLTQQSHFWEFILEVYLQISEEICIQECP